MNRNYHMAPDLSGLLPTIDLLSRSRELSEAAINEVGRITVEALLGMSAVQVAGPPSRGRPKESVRHHGSQFGSVTLSGRKVRVRRPRLRSKDGSEVPIPLYELLKQDPHAVEIALARVMAGVSTRGYKGIFDEAGSELGVSKSSISRKTIKAAEETLEELTSRPIVKRQLAVLIDGVRCGNSLAISAIGVDEDGIKTVLGLSEGATENSVTAGALLDSLIERGLDPMVPILFIIDGSKALRKAIASRFNAAIVQRCRLHKIRNVLEQLPKNKRRYMRAKIALCYRLEYKEALARLQELARELQVMHPGAAASLNEGLEETLTVSRLNLPPLLMRSLGTTNVIEASFSQAKSKLRRFTNISSGSMTMRWCAAALTIAEHQFRTLLGFKDLWMLRALLGEERQEQIK